MRHTLQLALLAAISLAAFSMAACGDDAATGEGADTAKATLYFSAIPDQGGTELTEKFGKVADYLSAELGVPVRYRPASDYGASVEMFKNGDIHLAWFGGLTGCQARAANQSRKRAGKSSSVTDTYLCEPLSPSPIRPPRGR